MNRYAYYIGNRKMTRKEFSRYLSENHYVKPLTSWGGLGVSIADYKAGARQTKRMQAEAKRQGFSQVIWCGDHLPSFKVVKL